MKTPDIGVKKILVVEDELAIGNLCQRVLTSEGFEVDIAANGKVARDIIRGEHYGLCLIDIRTPEMNGVQFYQWLKEKNHQILKGVIFTTGSIMGRDTMTFVEQTGRPFLPKPFTPKELKDIVIETWQQLEK